MLGNLGFYLKKNETRPFSLILCNSKWIRDISVRPEPLKLLEERVESALQDIGSREDFLNRTPITQKMRPTISKLDYKEFKGFSAKKLIA